jgi:hypothetical protein
MADDTDLLTDDQEDQEQPRPKPKPKDQPQSEIGSLPLTRQAPGAIGTPIAASTGEAAPAVPAATEAPALPQSIGAPINVPAPRPAGERLESLAAQGPPKYHGAKRFFDTLAGATKIGTAIERAGGLGTQGYEANLARAGGAANEEEAQIQAGEKERQANAQAEETGSMAEKNKALANMVTITTPEGHQISVPAGQAGTIYRQMISTEGAGKRNTESIQGRKDIETQRESAAQLLQSGKPVTMDQLAAQATKEGDQATLDKVEQYKKEIAAAGKQEPGNFQAVTTADGGIAGWVNPKSRDWVPAGSIAGGKVVQAAGGVAGPGGAPVLPPKPNALEQRMGKMAEYSVKLIDDAEKDIQNARDQLGPGPGRWNEFTTGKLGIKNTSWVKIDEDLTFVSGALTLAHSQGRVSNLILESFNKLLDAGKQDPDNLLQALEVGRRAMGEVQATMQGAPQNQTQGNKGPKAGDVEDGYRFKGGDPSKKENWEKAK